MEAKILAGEEAGVLVLHQSGAFVENAPQLGDLLRVVALGGELGVERLEGRPHFDQFALLLLREGRHIGAAPRLDGDDALGRQFTQRFPDRHARYAQLLRQPSLDQAFADRDVAGQDSLPKRRRDELGERGMGSPQRNVHHCHCRSCRVHSTCRMGAGANLVRSVEYRIHDTGSWE